ncbi:hypothetical protein [Acidithiobacillus sulfuriphilus]|uniref:Uncharacterized protein n=2 Tax=Acidithiobacillus sulfuriphilus TaxID=1867749 RepID=A0A3M8RJK3_9PROT|nr:hypothetical protein [Acidithiobacillus sulfuriphilus]RNF68535.1 hypothetical protein EC580_02890 [Acidithiobacillus sulfuriphilus]
MCPLLKLLYPTAKGQVGEWRVRSAISGLGAAQLPGGIRRMIRQISRFAVAGVASFWVDANCVPVLLADPWHRDLSTVCCM